MSAKLHECYNIPLDVKGSVYVHHLQQNLSDVKTSERIMIVHEWSRMMQ